MENITVKTKLDQFFEKSQSLERIYEEYALSKGLTYMSFTVLGIIYDNPESCTQKLIVDRSLYTKQSVNLIIKSFWQDGYVELKEDPADRRNKKIYFTGKGRIYADEVIGKLQNVEKQAMEQLSDDQWEQLLQMVDVFEKKFLSGMADLLSSNA
ncbi:MarR family winged helix-turn-helix transcriptional regulator [Planococcus shenhongbingii]|uniref:MarR family winged helix-turn-helix transcriptional regulator n=1 Tax=Planococcus shenhongbingii TaxID=3058398 RepID=A0ABT8NCL4_9BACL|nr:MarR family winged helix-turn-helix transcriptional regulator [Planococcus sp. N017]MDN7245638.1 MarR family winged helix-turn-helix transcriptional regulator [Planococcus sp. N017]